MVNILTATEALAQGSTPAVFYSIARFNEERYPAADRNPRAAQAARRVAVELAGLMGLPVSSRRKAAGNDNKRTVSSGGFKAARRG